MKKLSALTLTHLLVDLACFTVLFGPVSGALGGTALTTSLLFYNIIAFGLQAPLGAVLDSGRMRRPAAAALGAGITALGLLVSLLPDRLPVTGAVPLAGMAVAALGNALFHAAAGSSVLADGKGRLAPVGVFNSAGALGVGLGTLLGSTLGEDVTLPALIIAAALASFAALDLTLRQENDNCAAYRPILGRLSVELTIAALAVGIFLHSYASVILRAGRGLTGALTLIGPAFIFLGKALGGWLGDRLGARATLVGGMALSVPLLCLSGPVPWLLFPAMVLMNMAVPITQSAMAAALPDSPGFAFGLTKLALVAGTSVGFFLGLPEGAAVYVAAAVAVPALVSSSLAVTKKSKAK